VERDFEKAFKYFARCALGGRNWCYGSLINLARMYREGIYVEVDTAFAEYCETLGEKAEKEFTDNPGERLK